MSSEQFDKHIKKKLESVRPPYNEAAWKNFRKLLPLPWYVAFYREYKGWLYSSVCTIAVITTSYLLYNQRKENKDLNAKITTLNSQIAQSKNSPEGQLENLLPDTMQVRQRGNTTAPALPEVPEVTSPTTFNQQKISTNNPYRVTQPAAVNKTRRTYQENKGAANSLMGTSTGNKKVGEQVNSVKKDPDKYLSNLDERNNPAVMPKQALNQPVPRTNSSVESDSVKEANRILNDNTLNKNLSPDIKTDTVATTNVPTPEASANQKKAGSGLANVQVRAGLGADVNRMPKLAVGPVLELFFNSKVSFNAGLLFSAPLETRLQQPMDFDKATGKKFEDVYRPHIPHNDRIRDIKFRTSVIRMPVALHYYFATSGSLSFMAMAGTRLEFPVSESVEFRSYFQGEEHINRFEEKPVPRTFNNLFYGVGVQYKYGRLAGQVSPYFNSFFRYQDSFNRPSKIGLNVSLKFDLKK